MKGMLDFLGARKAGVSEGVMGRIGAGGSISIRWLVFHIPHYYSYTCLSSPEDR